MGCWNGTCGVSQLPLRHGDPVRAFLIGVPMHFKHGEDQSGYCYSDGWAYPLSVGFKGKYNDYGGIEEIEQSMTTDLIWNTYKDREFFATKSNYPEPGRSYDTERPIKVTSLEGFLNDVVERDCLYADKNFKIGIGLWMVHEDIYQAVLDQKILEQVHMLETHRFLEAIRQELAEEDKIKEEIKKDGGTDLDLVLIGKISGAFSGFLYDGDLDDLKVEIPEVKYKHYLRWPWMWRAQNGATTRALKPYRKLLVKALKENDEVAAQAIVRDVAEFDSFCGAMTVLRKGWVPQTGKGSQHDEYLAYLQLVRGMEKVINANLSDEEYDED